MDAQAEFERVTAAFAAELAHADPGILLGTVRWNVGQLAAHLGAVHRWAAANIRTGRRNPRTNVPELQVSPLEWYIESRAELLQTFEELPATATCYTLSRADSTVAFWHRRQLHESLVHLWDLRSRIPDAAPLRNVPADVWADNVDELFEVFLPRSSAADRIDLGGTLRLAAADVPREWVFAPDWTDGRGSNAAATVTAPIERLALFAWNRLPVEAVSVSGDPAVVARFRRADFRP